MTKPRSRHPRDIAGWLFEDRTTGKIVIAQAPNLVLLVFFGALAGHLFAKPGSTVGSIFRVIEVTSLAAWALDELVRGVNPWRRMLGAGTGVYMLTAWLLR